MKNLLHLLILPGPVSCSCWILSGMECGPANEGSLWHAFSPPLCSLPV